MDNQYLNPKKLLLALSSIYFLTLISYWSSLNFTWTSAIDLHWNHYNRRESILGSLSRMSKFILAPQPTFCFILSSRVFFSITVFVDKLEVTFWRSSFLESLILLVVLSRTNIYLKRAFLTKSKAHEGRFPHEVFGQLYILNQIRLQLGLGHFLIRSLISTFAPNWVSIRSFVVYFWMDLINYCSIYLYLAINVK